MRRRKRNLNLPTQNLDSFLDILTNTVGVLMFVSLFISLVAVESGKLVRTPLVSPSNKSAYFFEVSNNKIIFVDAQEVENKLSILMQSLPECTRPQLPSSDNFALYQFYLEQLSQYETCRQGNLQKIQNFEVQTGSYRVRFYDSDALVYEPLNQEVGDSIEELTQADSEFQTVLKQLNPQTNYLAFIVRPDSFSAFRLARQQAWRLGFDVGWEPHRANLPLVFGSQGRAIGAQ